MRRQTPIFVGIAGGTASGKTTVAEEILASMTRFTACCTITLDAFYKECTPEQMADIGSVNFDHPQIFDWDLLKTTLQQLKQGKDVTLPAYDYKTCKRSEPGHFRKWAPVVIFEGIFALLDQEINEKFLDFKIFVLTDDDVRLARRIQRDIVERGRQVQGVLKSYHKFVKPAHIEFVRPTMKWADLIVPRGRKIASDRNQIAIDFIVKNLEHKLTQSGFTLGQQQPQLQLEQSSRYADELQVLVDQSQKPKVKEIVLQSLVQELANLIESGTEVTFKPFVRSSEDECGAALFKDASVDKNGVKALCTVDECGVLQGQLAQFNIEAMWQAVKHK